MDTRKNFHTAITELQQSLTKMGLKVEETIFEAVQSLAEMNTLKAEAVIKGDDLIDEMTLQIEETCLKLLALQQPMAGDLRVIGTALKIAIDLERIADHACDIAKTTVRLSGEKLVKPLIDIPEMAKVANQMVRVAIAAYIDRDEAKAKSLAQLDDGLDSAYSRIFTEIVDLMGDHRESNRQLTHLLMVARMLERVGDHATNIGESVVYMVSGKRELLND